jgi:hypothetical protein
VVEWIAIGIAALAAYFAWRANHKSDDANDIARRALQLSEAEQEQMRREREARARLNISAHVMAYEPTDGVIRLGGSHGTLRVEIAVSNDGERDAGRGNVEVTLPLNAPNDLSHWSNPDGRKLAELPEPAARVGESNVLRRPIEGVAHNVPERMWFTVYVAVPDGDGVNDYPIRVLVAAEGADGEAVCDFPLKVGRDPSG